MAIELPTPRGHSLAIATSAWCVLPACLSMWRTRLYQAGYQLPRPAHRRQSCSVLFITWHLLLPPTETAVLVKDQGERFALEYARAAYTVHRACSILGEGRTTVALKMGKSYAAGAGAASSPNSDASMAGVLASGHEYSRALRPGTSTSIVIVRRSGRNR